VPNPFNTSYAGLWTTRNKKTYCESGQLLSSINYRDGIRNGPFGYFGAQDHLITEGNYLEGKLADVWTTYHDNGQIKRQVLYKYHVNKTTETQEGT
jgi:antitoxin component YwqK of YwqJK toxin-antitoxin module